MCPVSHHRHTQVRVQSASIFSFATAIWFAELVIIMLTCFNYITKIRQKISLIIVRMSILQAQLKHIMDKKQRNYAKDIGQ